MASFESGPHRIQSPSWVSWRSWDTIAIDLLNVPKELTTHDLYNAFNKEGTTSSIDIWENRHGEPEGKGRVRFRFVYSHLLLCLTLTIDRPPPPNDFWSPGLYPIKLRSGGVHNLVIKMCENPPETIPSPVRPAVKLPVETVSRLYPDPFQCINSRLGAEDDSSGHWRSFE